MSRKKEFEIRVAAKRPEGQRRILTKSTIHDRNTGEEISAIVETHSSKMSVKNAKIRAIGRTLGEFSNSARTKRSSVRVVSDVPEIRKSIKALITTEAELKRAIRSDFRKGKRFAEQHVSKRSLEMRISRGHKQLREIRNDKNPDEEHETFIRYIQLANKRNSQGKKQEALDAQGRAREIAEQATSPAVKKYISVEKEIRKLSSLLLEWSNIESEKKDLEKDLKTFKQANKDNNVVSFRPMTELEANDGAQHSLRVGFDRARNAGARVRFITQSVSLQLSLDEVADLAPEKNISDSGPKQSDSPKAITRRQEREERQSTAEARANRAQLAKERQAAEERQMRRRQQSINDREELIKDIKAKAIEYRERNKWSELFEPTPKSKREIITDAPIVPKQRVDIHLMAVPYYDTKSGKNDIHREAVTRGADHDVQSYRRTAKDRLIAKRTDELMSLGEDWDLAAGRAQEEINNAIDNNEIELGGDSLHAQVRREFKARDIVGYAWRAKADHLPAQTDSSISLKPNRTLAMITSLQECLEQIDISERSEVVIHSRHDDFLKLLTQSVEDEQHLADFMTSIGRDRDHLKALLYDLNSILQHSIIRFQVDGEKPTKDNKILKNLGDISAKRVVGAVRNGTGDIPVPIKHPSKTTTQKEADAEPQQEEELPLSMR